jgi:hypothetical protein
MPSSGIFTVGAGDLVIDLLKNTPPDRGDLARQGPEIVSRALRSSEFKLKSGI